MNPSFDDYEIDPRALELRRAGSRVEIAPMAVRILLYLVERCDRLVEREELYAHFWPEGGVDRERLLNTYVRQIRFALGERAGENRFLRTYPRRGYRFLATASPGGEKPTLAETATQPPYLRRATLVAVALVALIWGMSSWSSTDVHGPDPTSIPYRLGEELLSDPSPTARASAADQFRRALQLDPNRAAAYSGLAVSLFWAGDAVGAEGAARSALALSPGDSRAHLALGSALLQSKWAWDEAELHLRNAVRESPADPEPHVALAFLLVAAGHSQEGREMLDLAARLAPTDPTVTGDLGLMYGWLGDHESARELCQRTIAVEPTASWGHECVLNAAHAMGDSTEVVVRAETIVKLMGGDVGQVFARAENVEGFLGAMWRSVLEEARTSSMFQSALALAQLGQTESAVDALEEAALRREAGVPAIAVVPALRVLAGDARYDRLVREVRSSAN